jgi:hypothetical protein
MNGWPQDRYREGREDTSVSALFRAVLPLYLGAGEVFFI